MRKPLDHRTSKTYDIKPVDKRGNLDVDKIAKRETLVQLKNTKREEKAVRMLERFEEGRKKASQGKPFFDIGKRETNDVEKQKTTEIAQLVEAEQMMPLKNEDAADVREAQVTGKEETPEEVLEAFRKTFQEESSSEGAVADSDDDFQKNEQVEEQKQEKIQEKYSVIQGNQTFHPGGISELHIVKIENLDPQKLVEKENSSHEQAGGAVMAEGENHQEVSERGTEKSRIITREFIDEDGNFIAKEDIPAIVDKKEDRKLEKTEVVTQWMEEEERRPDVSKRRAVINPQTEDTQARRKERIETQKESRRELAVELETTRKKRSEELNEIFGEQEKNNESTKEDKVDRIMREKSNFDEPAIDNKLNDWFDCGTIEPTNKNKDTTEIAFKEKIAAIKKVEQKKADKKKIKFTSKIASSGKVKKQKKKFFSLNYRKKDEKSRWKTLVGKPMLSFVATSFMAFLIIGSVVFVSYGFQIQENIKVKGAQALGYLDEAKDQLKGQDFLSAETSFESAVKEFESAQKELDLIGGDILNVFSTFPILSKISSGKNVVDAGNELTKAAKELSGVVEILSELENPFGSEEGGDDKVQQSMLDALLTMQEKLKIANESLLEAEGHLNMIKIADLPGEYQAKFQKIQETLPMILSIMDTFEQNSEIFLELLGHNGPRKYLILFQNNQEMRATGGFIGSYGVLHISNGKIKKFLIEGIYNPDGQLKYDIVPPLPIQKISASWSTHDANWFPHFPKTAEKIAMFYEYTGGPTVDGIITMTPMVLQRMLAVTGPIEMDEYDIIVNSENFVEATQYEVEVDYDKTKNEPKQFLADLAPKIISELFDAKDPGDASEILEIFSDMLKERNIMINSSNKDVQNAISKRGWSGEILQTERDYLMVINSNINGFKTDGVVDEDITHNAKIAEDGTITNTVKIKRTHNGGDTDYEWWNKVNCDYMRVYVPKGSKLLSVKGQTREINESLLDYDKLGFKRDADVVREEENINIDEETGTRIYEEEGKTVFANWVYVSPKETVEIEYVYELPFKLDTTKNEQAADTYSLLVQKQAGSFGSDFSSNVEYDSEISPIWMYPQSLEIKDSVLEIKTKLSTDLFFGTVFQGEVIEKEEGR